MNRPCCAASALRPLGYELRCQSCGTIQTPLIDFTHRVYVPTVIKLDATRRLGVKR